MTGTKSQGGEPPGKSQLHVPHRASSFSKRGGHVQMCSKPRGARGAEPETFCRRGQLVSCSPANGLELCGYSCACLLWCVPVQCKASRQTQADIGHSAPSHNGGHALNRSRQLRRAKNRTRLNAEHPRVDPHQARNQTTCCTAVNYTARAAGTRIWTSE